MTDENNTRVNNSQDDQQSENRTNDEEVIDEEQAEEETDELDADTAQAIEDITAKIADLDAQIEAYRTSNIDAMKQAELKELGYTSEQVERYQTHIEGKTGEEIRDSVFKLSLEIPPQDNYGDPSPMNGAKVKPATVDKEEVGRSAVRRVLDKLRL